MAAGCNACACFRGASPRRHRGARGTTVPGGQIASDTVWKLADSPYVVQGQLDVAGGVTLTVDPGVTVKLTSVAWLQVFGTLRAEGTAGAPITFTSAAAVPQRGDWFGIEVRPGGAAHLVHCDVGHAGRGNGPALRAFSSDVTVQDCSLHDSLGDGAYLEGGGLHPTFFRVLLRDNGWAAIRQSEAGMSPTFQALSFSGNGQDGVVINIGWMSQSGTLDGAAMGAPFIADGVLGVSGGTQLTVIPGTTIKSRKGNGSIVVFGSLRAEGTVTQPITFTSDAATPHGGDWGTIEARPGSSLRFAHCDIAYAGQNSFAALRIYSSDVSLEDCQLHDNQADGAYLEGGGLHPTFVRVQARDNGWAAIRQSEAGMSPTFQALSFSGNGQDGVVINNGWTSQNGTLDGAAMGAPFIADGVLGVNGGTQLTITPGTTIRSRKGNGSVVVYGSLLAEGEAARPITFTSDTAAPQPGDWGGIELRGGSGRFANCDISAAGLAGYGALRAYSASLTVRDCALHDNQGDGIYLEGAGLRPVVERVRFERNGGAAIRQGDPGMSPVYRSLTLAGNNPDAIAIQGGALASSATWDTSAAGADILLAGTVSIPTGRLLSLAAGTTVRATAGALFYVNGALYALGTASAPVSLTAASGSPGGWRGVTLNPGANAILSHCELAYGGELGEPLLSIASIATVHACRIHHAGARLGPHAHGCEHGLAFQRPGRDQRGARARRRARDRGAARRHRPGYHHHADRAHGGGHPRRPDLRPRHWSVDLVR